MLAGCKFADIKSNYIEMDLISARNAGQAFAWSTMGAEAIGAIQDLRWMIALCIILIIADFRFGREESRKRYKKALAQEDATLTKIYEFRTSRAIRRTCNKFIDYMTLLLVFCIMGLAVTEPYGICNHVMTSGVAVILACVCELCSIAGHFFYLRGWKKPNITSKSILVFLGRFVAWFAKKKDEDLGIALEETIDQTLEEEKLKTEN